MVKRIKLVVSAMALVALAGCGGGGGGGNSGPTLSSIAVTPIAPTIGVNQTIQFTATGTNSDNSPVTTLPVIWNSSNPSFATINEQSGAASTVAPGSTTIRATSTTDGTISGTTTLTVQ